MTALETDPSEPGAVTKLSEAIARGRDLLAKTELFPIPFNAWLLQIRELLRKIYGRGSEAELQWPVGQHALPRDQARELLRVQLTKAERLFTALTDAAAKTLAGPQENRVFIGHGRSAVWRELKDFLQDRLCLPWEEFNREPVSGIATTQCLEHMLEVSSFAFLVMTAEDEHHDSTRHARANVIHEVGLFQGRLGTRRAIILLEEGCQEFSNILGLTHIPFQAGHLSAAFEDIRRVLEREGVTGT